MIFLFNGPQTETIMGYLADTSEGIQDFPSTTEETYIATTTTILQLTTTSKPGEEANSNNCPTITPIVWFIISLFLILNLICWIAYIIFYRNIRYETLDKSVKSAAGSYVSNMNSNQPTARSELPIKSPAKLNNPNSDFQTPSAVVISRSPGQARKSNSNRYH